MITIDDILSAVRDFASNDAAFSRYTSPDLWNDPWISRRMLEAHLNPDTDSASRRPGFIDDSVAFLIERFGLGAGSSVVDFGCGPGLYAQRLARAGVSVTGLDLSENSLAYARGEAGREGLPIRYVLGDYLEAPPPGKADLAIMIYCDFGVLGPDRRARLFANARAGLKPGGRFFFDACSLASLEGVKEERRWSCEDSGFFSPDPHILLEERRRYPAEKAFADTYLVIGEGRVCSYYCWNACFDEESLAQEAARNGFVVEDVYADAKGSPKDPSSPTIAVAARKR